jgi:carboxypeptidase C (cathepsin A)
MRITFLLLLSVSLWAQRPERPGEAFRSSPVPTAPVPDTPPVVTKHEVMVGGKTLHYTSQTGVMPIRNETGEIEAGIFYMAYTLDTDAPAARRPLTFTFNGGPGSSSAWLHLGAVGPKRVKMQDNGSLPPAPYQLVPNEATWLDMTDLVFIDPVGTGYSRATKVELARKYNGVQGDLDSVGEFIRLYLARNERFASPLFLAGESYGTTRAAGLAGHLVERGIAFNGVVLISTVLNFETLLFTRGNDLPFELILPTYTAIAWYHKRLPADLQKDLRQTLNEAKKWAETGYTEALAKGDRLMGAERDAVIEKLARYTGLSKRFLADSNLRVDTAHFTKELLRDRQRMVGRLDGRLTGDDGLHNAERGEFDPSNSAIRPPYTALFNQYVRSELGYKTDLMYYVLGGGIAPWDWGSAQGGFADTADYLRRAFAQNPHMKLLVARGYYDLATPFAAAEYSLNHTNLPPEAHSNIRMVDYEAGHMMYIHLDSLRKLRKDVGEFYQSALPTP